MEFLQMCTSMLTIVLMVGTGVILSKKGWISEEVKEFLIKIVVNLALPTLMFKNIYTDFSKRELLEMGSSVLLPLCSISVTMVIGIILAHVLRIREGQKGLFISMFFNSNTIFVGLPVNIALNGEACVPSVMLYYMASTILFWTLGVFFIASDSKTEKKRKLISKSSLKSMLSVPLLAFLLAVFWLMTELPMPSWILNTLGYFGNLTTPLSMIFIGTCIAGTSLGSIRMKKEITGVLLGRFLVAPCMMLIILSIHHLPPMTGKVFVIQAAMPVMTNTAILARAYHCDEDYAAMMTILTTLLCMIVVPVYCMIFEWIF